MSLVRVGIPHFSMFLLYSSPVIQDRDLGVISDSLSFFTWTQSQLAFNLFLLVE